MALLRPATPYGTRKHHAGAPRLRAVLWMICGIILATGWAEVTALAGSASDYRTSYRVPPITADRLAGLMKQWTMTHGNIFELQAIRQEQSHSERRLKLSGVFGANLAQGQEPPIIHVPPGSERPLRVRGQSPDPQPLAPPPAARPVSPSRGAAPAPTGASAPPASSPEAQMVVDVRVLGNETVTPTKLQSHIRTRRGRPLDTEMVEEDVQRLNATRWFIEIKPLYQQVPGGVAVIFQVVERPSVKEIHFIGNDYVRIKVLKKQIDLKVGGPIDPYAVDDGRRKIEDFYRERGFHKVRVEVAEGDKSGDRRVVYVINEGPKQKIGDVEFFGNTIATDARLKTQIQSKTPILHVPHLIEGFKGFYDEEKLAQDVDKLTSYYRSLGFFQAKVSYEPIFKPDQKWATVRFVINEGIRYKVRNISFVGNKKYTVEELVEKTKLRSGQHFDQLQMDADLQAVRDEYGGIGHVFADIQAEPRFLEEPGELDLVFSISEGAKARVGTITVNIKGDHPHTKQNAVLNQLSFAPGDIIDIREIRNSERRLKLSGIFGANIAQGQQPPQIVYSPPGTEGGEEGIAEKPRRNRARGQSPDPQPNAVARPMPGMPVPVFAPAPQNPTPPAPAPMPAHFQTRAVAAPQPAAAPQHPAPAVPQNFRAPGSEELAPSYADQPVRGRARGQSPDPAPRTAARPAWPMSPASEVAPASPSRTPVPSNQIPHHLRARRVDETAPATPPQYPAVPPQPGRFDPQLYRPMSMTRPATSGERAMPVQHGNRHSMPIMRGVSHSMPIVRGQSPELPGGDSRWGSRPAEMSPNARSAARPNLAPAAGQPPVVRAQYTAPWQGNTLPSTTPQPYPTAGAPVAGASAMQQPYAPAPYGAQPYAAQPYGAQPYTAPAAPAYAPPANGYQPLPGYAPQTAAPPPGSYPQPYAAPAPGGYAPPPTATQASPYGDGPPGYLQSAPPVSAPPASTQPPPAAYGPPVEGYDTPGSLFPENQQFPQALEDEPTITVPINVNVEETQTGRLMFGVGINSDAGLVGSVIMDEQNFDWRRLPRSWDDIRNATAWRGAGQQLRIEAVPGSQLQRYMVTFREPYLADTPVSLTLSGFLFDRRYFEWDEQRIGGRTGLGYQFSPDLSGTVTIGGQSVKIRNPAVPTPQELADVVGDNELWTARAALVHDTRDSAFLPTEGHRIELAYEQGFGQFDYPRGIIEVSQYFLLHERPDRSGRQTLMLRSVAGFSGSQTPIFENFFAGGFSTLRGFDFRGASPREMGIVVGGEFQWLNTVEYMFPITADDMLRGVVFCDFGTVEQSIEINADNFRVAPGFGLRVSVAALGPAPIALDFAVPVAHAPGDNIQNFSFFVGLAR